ncbi:MAG: RNA-binding S4 domain-containing protein [Dysgonamonadaceae bacterium]|jgi:ribosome-associated heat shock protein Hsp15|nr:RNA-binding S4 domain-containing protein [Dysgonamonadaceae bacterium]
MNEVRIDKWMWAMRIFKTRTLAVEACKKNRILVNDTPAKPSRTVKTGDLIQVRKPPVTYTFKALQLTDKRIGASLVPEYLEDVTPPEQYELMELNKIGGFIDRARGTGRPTKKERRDLDDFLDDRGDIQ